MGTTSCDWMNINVFIDVHKLNTQVIITQELFSSFLSGTCDFNALLLMTEVLGPRQGRLFGLGS